MEEKLLKDAIQASSRAVGRWPHYQLRDIAKDIKTSMDSLAQPSWHCIVGRSFGSYVSHEQGSFIYLYVHDLAIQIFKA